MQKNIKGITLIALVITIIILLILAGVTITMLTGENGILKKAQLAEQEYKDAQQKEEADLEKLYSQIQVATNDSSKITISMSDLNSLIETKVKEQRQMLYAYTNGLSNQITTTKEDESIVMPLKETRMNTNKLTLENNGIKIGKGVNLIKIDFVVSIDSPSDSIGYMYANIYKNDKAQNDTRTLSSIIYVSTISNNTLLEVEENDIITFRLATRRPGTFKYYAPSILVEIIK